MFEKEQSRIIGIYVVAKLGKQFYIGRTCFNIVHGSYNCCKANFLGYKKSSDFSVSYAMRSYPIEGFFFIFAMNLL